MAVGKRLRYEVLRRDNHTCRYCGRCAPEVRLTVDHVLPVALGGRDEAENLVACCADCNSGKTSTTPDAPLVADVQDSALRWSAAMHAAIVQASADHAAQVAYRDRFLEAWKTWKNAAGTIPLDETWDRSVETFRARGLPIEILLDDIRTAMAATHVKAPNTFRYLCGIAWKQIEKIDAAARALFEQDSSPTADEPFLDRVTRAVLETAALVWREYWCQAHGAEPPEGLESEVREHAAELYPEEVSASALIAAAELCGQLESSALSDFVDGEEEPFESQIAHALTHGWSARYQTSPTPGQWQTTLIQALAANVAGYTADSVAQAVMHAASAGSVDADGNLDVFAALATPRGLLLEGYETFAEMARTKALTQEQLDGRMEIALDWRAARQRAREEREARGEKSPWDPEQ